MAGLRHEKKTKERAGALRRSGKTYREITDLLTIPKSTLSVWFSGKSGLTRTPEKRNADLARARIAAIVAIRAKKAARLQAVKEKVAGDLLQHPSLNIVWLKSLLGVLYWAEGSKHTGVAGIKLANTDPQLMLLYVTLLRTCFLIDETKFRVRLHLHYYHKIRETRTFWCNTLSIPETQCTGTFIKKRSRKKRFRKNFMGICFVYYGNSAIREEILELARQLQHTIITPVDLRP